MLSFDATVAAEAVVEPGMACGRRGARSAARARQARWPGWVPSLLAALLAVVSVIFGSAPASAAPVPYTYDTVAYPYDATARSSVPHALVEATRWSPAGPGAVSWVSPVLSGRFGVAANTARFGPMRAGLLPDAVASTFRSGSYTATELAETTTLYRAYGGDAGALGRYWSRVRPSGPLQAQLDSALNPAWGNTASEVATIRVPAGTTIYEGAAASQPIPGGSLMGGGSQVYIPNVPPAWLVP